MFQFCIDTKITLTLMKCFQQTELAVILIYFPRFSLRKKQSHFKQYSNPTIFPISQLSNLIFFLQRIIREISILLPTIIEMKTAPTKRCRVKMCSKQLLQIQKESQSLEEAFLLHCSVMIRQKRRSQGATTMM